MGFEFSGLGFVVSVGGFGRVSGYKHYQRNNGGCSE